MYELRVERSGPGTLVVWVSGEVDMAAERALDKALRQALAADGARRVVVDATDLSFLDSSGIHALVKGHHAARNSGVAFSVRNATGAVRRVLEVTGVADLLGLDP